MKRILIVDDAPIIRLKLRDIIQRQGYEVVAEAANGREAVEKYKELSPDLTTLDITMPDMDGLEALEEIFKINPEAKVVMVTAIEQRDMLMKAIRMGIQDYIVKPFENDRVINAVHKSLGE